MNFVSYPKRYPYQSGYYMTRYYNSNEKKYLYKGLCWDNKTKEWLHGRIPIPSDLYFSYNPTSPFYTGLLDKIN